MKNISKKLVVAVLGAALLIANKKFDLGLDAATQSQLAAVLSAYLIGQGVADFGKGAK